MLTDIWLTPPLAFARVGGSPTPSDAYMWGANELTPDGTGKTSLVVADTLDLDANGNVSLRRPDSIVFRDERGIRPVCPYYELHGTWTTRGKKHSAPITKTILQQLGVRATDIRWTVHAAQLKAFHYTYDVGDRLEAVLQLSGGDTKRHRLLGHSPKNAKRPLTPRGAFVPFGGFQVAKLSDAFPEVRARFYAPAGLTYGPTNVEQRIAAADLTLADNREWRALKMPKERQILNPNSAWAKHVLERSTLGPFLGADPRNLPNFLFAFLLVGPNADEAEHHGLGLVDDTSDGTITCSIKIGRRLLTAHARFVVGPPDFGPASRPPISLADSLADRADRAGPRRRKWTQSELRELVLDIFERAHETSDQMNKDYQNSRCHLENAGTLSDLGSSSPYDAEDVDEMLWPDMANNVRAVQIGKASPFELSEAGLRKHRRQAAIEYLEDRLRENPEEIDQWIRRPLDPNPFFDRRMPALMRGADSRPWHLTRRQWEILRLWVRRLQQKTLKPLVAKKPRTTGRSRRHA